MTAISRWWRRASDDTTGVDVNVIYATQKGSQRGGVVGSTFLSLHYHLVFSTKGREPVIEASWRLRLHEYLGGTINGLGGFSEGVGGVEDHVHLLVGLRATHCLADVLRELKKASTLWAREEIRSPSFQWQEGYAAFTVSATAREQVRAYIARQEEHHRAKSSRDELKEMLGLAGVAWDPRYLE
ncbi:MAG: IS200/IS605 family transposase [Pirellulales bacterium]